MSMKQLLRQMNLPVITEDMADLGALPITVTDIVFTPVPKPTQTVLWARTRETDFAEDMFINKMIDMLTEAMAAGEDWCLIKAQEVAA